MKTKDMILGPLAKCLQHLSDCSTNNPVIVERVQHFKLVGITVSHDRNLVFLMSYMFMFILRSKTRHHL